MTSSFALILMSSVLIAVGVYLVLERSLSRIIIGLTALTNGINILFLVAGGRSGRPPFVGGAEPEEMADPLAQAMMLTSIVISLATTGFLLALAYRSWQLNGNDEVQDDLEDKRIAQRSEQEKIDARADALTSLEAEAEATKDETEGFDPVLTRFARSLGGDRVKRARRRKREGRQKRRKNRQKHSRTRNKREKGRS